MVRVKESRASPPMGWILALPLPPLVLVSGAVGNDPQEHDPASA